MSDIIAGRNPIIEALKAGRPINRILLAENIGRHSGVAEILRMAREQGVPVEYVVKQALDDSGTPAHQGVVAYTAAKDYVSLEDLLDISRERGEPPFYCILDGVEDPQNLGSILRTAEAAGVHGVVVRSRRAVGLTAAVAKASAGAVEYVPVARVNNIAQAIEDLKKKNIWVTGVDPEGKADYAGIDYRPATAIVVGGEGQGLSALVGKRCDYLVSIPMRGKIGSLNVSVAAALVMYEAARQRNRK
jgi:23S rRNA (guanosine2251-2'-O)-methyltransferase